MPLIPRHKNAVTLVKGLRERIEANTGIRNFDRDSKTRALMDAFVNEFIALRSEEENVWRSNHESTADGKDLDALLEAKTLSRLEPTFAKTNASEQNMLFYVDSGTFGDINSGNDIPLPKGTIVYSAPDTNELGKTIQYSLLNDTTFLSTASIHYVSVEAKRSGATSNVGRGVLNRHNFTTYTDSVNGSLKCTNVYPILNGREQESNQQYRVRGANAYASIVSNNETKIKLLGLQIPGVVGLKVIPGYFGVGSVGVVVLGPENQSSPSLIDAVQFRLNQIKGPGDDFIATPATSVVVDFSLTLTPTRTLTTAEQDSIKQVIRRETLNFLGSARIGATLSLTTLAAAIRAQTSGLISIQTDSEISGTFSSVFLRKGIENTSVSERRQLLGLTITLQEDEYVTLGDLEISYGSI